MTETDLSRAVWRKSSYSGQDGNCVEVARAEWRKSSYSGQSGNCVEVARHLPARVAIRDSKSPDGPSLLVSPETWRAFLLTLRG